MSPSLVIQNLGNISREPIHRLHTQGLSWAGLKWNSMLLLETQSDNEWTFHISVRKINTSIQRENKLTSRTIAYLLATGSEWNFTLILDGGGITLYLSIQF